MPLSRLHPLYHDCSHGHQSFERVFAHWRSRYLVYGDNDKGRLCRWSESVHAQRLRAEMARFLEWFRLCLRFGWIAGHKTLKRERLFATRGRGAGFWNTLLRERRGLSLDLPYGPAAERVGLWVRPDPPPGSSPPKPPPAPPPKPEPDENGDVPF